MKGLEEMTDQELVDELAKHQPAVERAWILLKLSARTFVIDHALGFSTPDRETELKDSAEAWGLGVSHLRDLQAEEARRRAESGVARAFA